MRILLYLSATVLVVLCAVWAYRVNYSTQDAQNRVADLLKIALGAQVKKPGIREGSERANTWTVAETRIDHRNRSGVGRMGGGALDLPAASIHGHTK